MAKAELTYEVRKLPEAPLGIEDYVVRTRDGEPVGTVAAVLEREHGERLLVVEAGVPPLRPVQRAVDWPRVDRVDHDAVALWLTLDREAFEREALELDPDRAVEEGEGGADARRLAAPPAELIPDATVPGRGPVDRARWAAALTAFGATVLAALAATSVVGATGDTTWAILFLVPAALALVTVVVGYRAYRSPYEARGARKP